MTLSWHALLDDAVPKIGVDQSTLGTCNSFAKPLVNNAFPSSEPGKFLSLVDLPGATSE